MDPVTTPDDPTTREPGPSAGRATAARDALSKPHINRPTLNRASLGRMTAQANVGASRRIQVAVGVIGAIGVGLVYGYGVAPAAAKPQANVVPKSTAVRTAMLACPEITGPSDASVNAITPSGVAGAAAPATGDTATLTAVGAKAPLATLKQTGTLSVNPNLSGDIANLNEDSTPVVGQASGGYAPGFTLTETLASGSSSGLHGLASTTCTAPDTDFWYLGADPGPKSTAKINFFDTDQIAAQVNLSAYTLNGPVGTQAMQLGQGLLVHQGDQLPVDLSGFNNTSDPVGIHVVTTAGRVVAALLDSDGFGGRDFIQAQRPSAHMVLPGVPAPSGKANTPMKLQLILLSPTADTDVTLHWIGGSKITPTVTVPHLAAGKVQQVDISSVPATGEAGALQIDSSNETPFLAEIKITGEGGNDTAYLSPVAALTGESIVADDNPGSVVELTNNGAHDAQVTVTAEGNGTPAPQTITVPAQSTKAVTVNAPPKGNAPYAISVTPTGGASSIYAARVMTDGSLITVQPMTTALETVQIPPVRDDLSGVVPQ